MITCLNDTKFTRSDPGCLTFAQPRIEANVDIGTAKIEVKRINGKDGKVGCFWNTMEISGRLKIDRSCFFYIIIFSKIGGAFC